MATAVGVMDWLYTLATSLPLQISGSNAIDRRIFVMSSGETLWKGWLNNDKEQRCCFLQRIEGADAMS